MLFFKLSTISFCDHEMYEAILFQFPDSSTD